MRFPYVHGVELNLALLPEGSSEQQWTESIEHLLPDSVTCRFEQPTTVRLTIQKTQDEAVLEGYTKARAELSCVRCLKKFAIDLHEPFRIVVHLVSNDEAADDTGDENYYLVGRQKTNWDIAEVARDLLILAVPLDPLCQRECAGLCDGCGVNLNDDLCECIEDSRTGSLADLASIIKSARSDDSDSAPQ